MLLNEERFKSAFAGLVVVADDILERAYENKVPHGVQGWKYELNNDGGLTGSGIYKIDYRVALLTVDQQLKSAREYTEVSEIVSGISVFQGEDDACWITSEGAGWRLALEELIFQSLQAVLEKEGEDYTLDIDRVYRQIEDYFSNTTIQQSAFIVLENVGLQSKQIRLEEDLSLKSISPSMKVSLLNEIPILEHFYGFPISGPYYALRDIKSIVRFVLPVNKAIVRYEDRPEPTPVPITPFPPQPVRRLLDSVRLCSPQRVSVGPTIIQKRSSPVQEVSVLGGRFDRTKPGSPNQNLTKSDEDRIAKLYQMLTASKVADKSMEIALSRLRTMDERESDEDRLLDLITGIERVMAPIIKVNDAQVELRFRLSLGLAKYLRQQPSDQENTFRRVMKAYKLRSHVTHGGNVEASDRETIIWLADMYKELLVKYIEDATLGRLPKLESLLFPTNTQIPPA